MTDEIIKKADLEFFHGPMEAGKSGHLINVKFNYEKKGMTTLAFTPAIDTRSGLNKIRSRMGNGMEIDAISIQAEDNIYEIVKEKMPTMPTLVAVLVDESQFLTEDQVWQLSDIVDELNITAMAFGLKSDFQGKLFPASALLLSIANKIEEEITVCWCNRKAIMNARISNGKMVTEGEQIQIGDEEYISLCRRHWRKRQIKPE